MTEFEELKKRLAKEQRALRIRRFTKNKAAVFGLIVVLLVIVLAILAPVLTSYDPLALDTVNRLKPCSAEHLFGTDTMGRDVFTRVLYGARISSPSAFWWASFPASWAWCSVSMPAPMRRQTTLS